MDITGLMTTSKAAHFAMSAQSLSKARRHFTGMFPDVTKADVLGAIYLAHADTAVAASKEEYGVEIAV